MTTSNNEELVFHIGEHEINNIGVKFLAEYLNKLAKAYGEDFDVVEIKEGSLLLTVLANPLLIKNLFFGEITIQSEQDRKRASYQKDLLTSFQYPITITKKDKTKIVEITTPELEEKANKLEDKIAKWQDANKPYIIEELIIGKLIKLDDSSIDQSKIRINSCDHDIASNQTLRNYAKQHYLEDVNLVCKKEFKNKKLISVHAINFIDEQNIIEDDIKIPIANKEIFLSLKRIICEDEIEPDAAKNIVWVAKYDSLQGVGTSKMDAVRDFYETVYSKYRLYKRYPEKKFEDFNKIMNLMDQA